MILNPLKQRPVNTLAAVLHRLRRAVRFCLVGGELRQDENCVLRVRTPMACVAVKVPVLGFFLPQPGAAPDRV